MKPAATPRKRAAATARPRSKRASDSSAPDPKRTSKSIAQVRALAAKTEAEVQELSTHAETSIRLRNAIAVRRIEQCKHDTLEYTARWFDHQVRERAEAEQKALASVQSERDRYANVLQAVHKRLAELKADDPSTGDALAQCARWLSTDDFKVWVPTTTRLQSANTVQKLKDRRDYMADTLCESFTRYIDPSYDLDCDDSNDDADAFQSNGTLESADKERLRNMLVAGAESVLVAEPLEPGRVARLFAEKKALKHNKQLE